jgi:hypothetical protein
VEASSASSVKAFAVEASKAGLSSEGIGSGIPTMAKPTEGAGMHSAGNMCRITAMKRLMPTKTSAMRIGAMIGVRSTSTKTIAIDDRPAMRDVRVVVVYDSPIVVPIVSPMAPAPAEAAK